jgi:hypothetical protein
MITNHPLTGLSGNVTEITKPDWGLTGAKWGAICGLHEAT